MCVCMYTVVNQFKRKNELVKKVSVCLYVCMHVYLCIGNWYSAFIKYSNRK